MAGSNQIANTVANASTGTAAITGTATASASLTSWVSSNSIVIGVICTVMSLIVALIFHIINYRLAVKSKNDSYELEKASAIAAMKKQGLSDCDIKRILKMSGVSDANKEQA